MRFAHIFIGLVLSLAACATTAPATTPTTPTRAIAAEPPRRFDMVAWMRNRQRGTTPQPVVQPSSTPPSAPLVVFTWADTARVVNTVAVDQRRPPRRPVTTPTSRTRTAHGVCIERECIWYDAGPRPSLLSPGVLRLWDETIAAPTRFVVDSFRWSARTQQR